MDSDLYAVLATILYSDIFQYPLTKQELWYYLLTSSPMSRVSINRALQRLQPVVIEKQGKIVLKDRAVLLNLRKDRRLSSNKKLIETQRVSRLLMLVPTILFIGVSGSVAMANADELADSDIFIITKCGTVWITRLLVVGLLHLLGKRRLPSQRQVNHTICANMLIDETMLAFPPDRQDMYTAHEVVQLLPLYERDHIYERLLRANSWTRRYLPNARSGKKQLLQSFYQSRGGQVFAGILRWFDRPAKRLQLWYMDKRRTTETVTDHMAAFHPHDYRVHLPHILQKKLQQYEAKFAGSQYSASLTKC